MNSPTWLKLLSSLLQLLFAKPLAISALTCWAGRPARARTQERGERERERERGAQFASKWKRGGRKKGKSYGVPSTSRRAEMTPTNIALRSSASSPIPFPPPRGMLMFLPPSRGEWGGGGGKVAEGGGGGKFMRKRNGGEEDAHFSSSSPSSRAAHFAPKPFPLESAAALLAEMSSIFWVQDVPPRVFFA